MRKLKNWFLKNFVCPTIFAKGHIPVREVREDDFRITQWKCERCDCTLGLGFWKHIPYHPDTVEGLEQQKKWREEKMELLRKGIEEAYIIKDGKFETISRQAR